MVIGNKLRNNKLFFRHSIISNFIKEMAALVIPQPGQYNLVILLKRHGTYNIFLWLKYKYKNNITITNR